MRITKKGGKRERETEKEEEEERFHGTKLWSICVQLFYHEEVNWTFHSQKVIGFTIDYNPLAKVHAFLGDVLY